MWIAESSNAQLLDHQLFPNLSPPPSSMVFSAKACSLANVSASERVYIINPETERGSRASRGEQSSGGGSSPIQCSVATATYGQGRILYVGDVNAEESTCEMVAGFCCAAAVSGGARLPYGRVPEDELQGVKRELETGNVKFRAGEYEAALAKYDDAIWGLRGRYWGSDEVKENACRPITCPPHSSLPSVFGECVGGLHFCVNF